MKAELPPVLASLLPDAALGVAVRLSKELLRKHSARVKGDKSLIDSAVASARVTALRHDTCGVAPYKGGQEGDFSEITVACLRLHPEVTPSQTERLQQLLHIAVQYPLLLIADNGQAVHISILPQGASVDSMARAQVLPTVPEFLHYVRWQQEPPPPHLLALFNRWYCAVHALALMQNKPAVCAELPFVPQASPAAAAQLSESLRRLNAEWKAVAGELRKSRNPQQRITLAKQRHQLATQIKNLLITHNIIP